MMRKQSTAKTAKTGPKGGQCIGFDVITSRGRRVGVIEDVYKTSRRGIGTCLLLARKIPGVGLRHFLLPLRRVVFDPISDCFVWNPPQNA